MNNSRTFAIRRKWMTAADVVGLELVPTDGRPLDSFTPGAHVEFRLRRAGGPPLLRHYSLCNAPHEQDAYVVGVKREPQSRGGSQWLHEQAQVGDSVELGTPRNHFPLSETAGSHLLLAAGIGVTPLLAMMQALEARQVPHELHYFVRSMEHVAFAERMLAGRTTGRIRIHAGLDGADTRLRLERLLLAPPDDMHAYACGPGVFMDAVAAIGQRAWGPRRLHFEHFQGNTLAAAVSDTGFEVELKRQGRVIAVPTGQTVVQAMQAANCPIDVSCEQGVCGTCLTTVLDGEPDHRDSYLTDEERSAGRQFLPCVSRARSPRLVLDC